MRSNSGPTLADVDGTDPGRVQVELADLTGERPEVLRTYYFEEKSGEADPWLRAEMLKRDIEDDWPGCHWEFVGNWRARYLDWARRFEEWGFDGDHSPQEYLRTLDQGRSTGDQCTPRHAGLEAARKAADS